MTVLGITRRRVLSGIGAAVVSGALVLSVAPPASATPVVIAPLIPEVAADVGGAVAAGCAATGPGCAIVAAGALAYSAWWLYNNQDTMLGWIDQTLGQPNNTSNSPSSGGAWVLYQAPDAAAGPYTRATSTDTAFSPQCQNATCGNATMLAKCVATNGTVSSLSWGMSTASPGTVYQTMGTGCVSPSRVGEVAVQMNTGGQIVQIWHAGGSWDPIRTTTVNETCKTPGGTSTVYATTTTNTVTSSNRQTAIPACPAGTYVTKVEVKDGTGAATYPRVEWQAKPTLETTYANCFTGSTPGLGGCLLTVKYLGVACDETMANCQYWWDRSQTHLSDYQCLWGPYSVPLSSCRPMMYAYVPGNGVDSTTLLPAQQSSPSPSPTTSAQALPTSGPNPSPSAVATDGTWTAPPNPFPTNGSTPTATPITPAPAPAGQNCMESGWSWNPVSWVFVPIKCALSWAFVPDSAVVSQVQTQASGAWASSSPGLWTSAAFTALGPLGSIGSSESGTYACGIPVHFPFYSGHSIDFVMLNSCEPPLDTLAPIVKGFLTAVVIVNGLWLSLRILGTAFGWQLPGIGRGATE